MANNESQSAADESFQDLLGKHLTFSDDATAPSVDRARLERYYRDELESDEKQEVRDCIVTFRSWYDAFFEIVRSHADRVD